MKNTPNQQQRNTTRLRTLFGAALALGCAFIMVPGARAQSLTPPATPTDITPPAGNSLFLVGNALGTQGYVCLPTAAGASTASWTAKGARPEATLFQTIFGQKFQIITHFLSPDTNPNDVAPNPLPFGSATWQSSLDSSKVWAAVLDPKKNAIPSRIRRELSEYRLHCLPPAYGNRFRPGSLRRQNLVEDNVHPTAEYSSSAVGTYSRTSCRRYRLSRYAEDFFAAKSLDCTSYGSFVWLEGKPGLPARGAIRVLGGLRLPITLINAAYWTNRRLPSADDPPGILLSDPSVGRFPAKLGTLEAQLPVAA